MDFKQLPIGFAMELAQNPAAMNSYAALPREPQSAVLQQARGARSKTEMRTIVSSISKV